ncbi:hypothetical protein HYC85_021882 [Camellia sinensis]|uniref:Uncharacterized protein n=1 Tax=Camellia sinensis TaxID=4442 RepID=A0A7J7GKF0_CAMSI|nr:hypothetical protein HYC85_021882 [Camellia sinensis]
MALAQGLGPKWAGPTLGRGRALGRPRIRVSELGQFGRRDLQKYDKYDFDKQKHLNLSAADDAFARLYAAVDSDIDAALQLEKAEAASNEESGASAVAINAEIRRTKARLLEEVPKLERLAIKKVKGLSTEELAARNDLVLALPDRIQAIPDGTAAAPKQSGGWTGSASRTEIKFDSGNGSASSLMDEIDTKVDKAASDLKNTNVRLKDTVNQTIGEDTGWWCHNVVEDTVWWCHNGGEDTVWWCQTDVEDSLWGHVGPL